MLRLMCDAKIIRTYNDNEGVKALQDLELKEASNLPDEDGNCKDYWLADDRDYALYCGYTVREDPEW
jgi:hypothetical protein